MISETKTNLSHKMNFGPLFIAFAAFLWTTDTLVRTNLEGLVTSTQIVFLDHLVIALIISPLIVKYFPKLLEFNKKEWGAILFVGIGGSALATIALTEGFFTGDFPFQYVAIVILLQQTQPIFAITFSHLLLKEKLPKFYYILAPIALFGIFLIISPYFYDLETNRFGFSDLASASGFIAGMFGLTAAFFWGSSTVFGRFLLNHGEAKPSYIQMTTFRFFVGAMFLLIFTPFLPLGGYPSIDNVLIPEVAYSILYLALIVGLFSLVLYYFGLKTTHASVASISELAYPLSFFVLIPIFKLEWPSEIQMLGGLILIIASTTLSFNYGRFSEE